ncbi:hypothetical protein GCM10009756_16170 [Pseudokineococcus marinus]
MVDVNPVGLDAEGLQGVALGGEVLAGGRDPGVADLESGHGTSVSYDAPVRDFNADGSIGTPGVEAAARRAGGGVVCR